MPQMLPQRKLCIEPNLGTNTPYSVHPYSFVVPANTPIGDYKLCAKIDYNYQYSESSEADNLIISDTPFTVEDPEAPGVDCEDGDG